MKTTLYLARHGETEWTASDQFNGRSNIALSAQGRIQAQKLADRLSITPFAAAYSSPLQRCQDTALLITARHDIKLQTVDDLRELDYGVWEGMQRQAIVQQYPHEWDRWSHDPASTAPPKGETGYSALARFTKALDHIVQEHQGERLLVVAHKAVNRLFLCHALGVHPRDYRRRIDQQPCAMNCIVWHNFEPMVTVLNDCSHYNG